MMARLLEWLGDAIFFVLFCLFWFAVVGLALTLIGGAVLTVHACLALWGWA